MNLSKVINMQELRQKQEDPLNLGSLPLLKPEEDGWPAIETALLEQSRQRRLRRVAGISLAAAASLVLAFTLMIGKPFNPGEPAAPELTQAPPVQEADSAPLKEPTLESLIAMSQQLEGRVRLYRNRLGDLPSGALVYQVELQDLIVQVDEQLSMNPQSAELWGQRVNLLLDVTQLYENSLRRDYQQMASL